jgi:hypothetical protein
MLILRPIICQDAWIRVYSGACHIASFASCTMSRSSTPAKPSAVRTRASAATANLARKFLIAPALINYEHFWTECRLLSCYKERCLNWRFSARDLASQKRMERM